MANLQATEREAVIDECRTGDEEEMESPSLHQRQSSI